MEDAVIAWTWKKFIDNTSNPYELALMPMTKVYIILMFFSVEVIKLALLYLG